MSIERISLSRLRAHPGNANILSRDLKRKLRANIESTGRYPPLIVRPHPHEESCYEILDGHHRAEILRELGHSRARCDVWREVDDRRAVELLLTLNRLTGSDDPLRRADLLDALRRGEQDVASILKRIPENRARLERLLALRTQAPPSRARSKSQRPEGWLQPITFFLSARRKATLIGRLREIGRDRNEALARVLNLDAQVEGGDLRSEACE